MKTFNAKLWQISKTSKGVVIPGGVCHRYNLKNGNIVKLKIIEVME